MEKRKEQPLHTTWTVFLLLWEIYQGAGNIRDELGEAFGRLEVP